MMTQAVIEVLWKERQTTEKLDTVGGVRFRDVCIIDAVAGGDAGKFSLVVVQGGARGVYAGHFSKLQKGIGRTGTILTERTGGRDIVSYVPFYQCEAASLGKTIYAFYAKTTDAVALMIADCSLNVTGAIVDLGVMIPFGKRCVCCGSLAAAGEAKFKKCPCKLVRYCSRRCQLAHWDDHRRACLPKEERRLL